MKVYILTVNNYDEHENIDVFFSKEKATAAANRANELNKNKPMSDYFNVEEMDVIE